jgi:hypothetical protein
MSKTRLIEEFVDRKKARRKDQARLPMAEKARIVEDLRDRHLSFRAIRARRKKLGQS